MMNYLEFGKTERILKMWNIMLEIYGKEENYDN